MGYLFPDPVLGFFVNCCAHESSGKLFEARHLLCTHVMLTLLAQGPHLQNKVTDKGQKTLACVAQTD